ncbi:MAG: GAF domain-containing protein [Labilithrix sp.]|nr:GAF domain-containing protein [Labilithrix sp.]MCW5810544.1 GAF domain-containing protein [Labilithrix sp.]
MQQPALVEKMSKLFAELQADNRVDDVVTQPHPLLIAASRDDLMVILAPAAVWERGKDLLKPFAKRFAESTAMMILLGMPAGAELQQMMNRGLASIVSAEPSKDELFLAGMRAFELLEAKGRAESRGKWLNRYRYELGELINIARAMTTERDVNKLLGVILEKCRFVTGADAGSIYVVEAAPEDTRSSQPPPALGGKKDSAPPPSISMMVRGPMLRFKLSQNDSVAYDSSEFVMPISNRSIAGSVVLAKKPINIEDAYEIPVGTGYGFDRRFDEKIGYRTKSMLTVPLVSQRDEVIGVIQLINKKKDPEKRLYTKDDFDEQVVPFDDRSEELLGMVAAQAGVSLENTILYDEIKRLFDGFVKASVEAIESRDPTTSGHSRRVADLTVALAKVVDAESSGPYKDAHFSREDLRELEYASLLHDFGKIGVREKVLVKAKKLYDESLSLIRARFDFVARSLEADILRRKLAIVERGGSKGELERLDKEHAERRAELDAAWETIEHANEPTVLAAGDFAKIEHLAKETYFDLRGEMKFLLEPQDAVALSVKRGSLTPAEYDEITSHVVHTFKFLSNIPWGKSFRRVPLIAGAHHERVNGTGYPNRLRAEEIPVQSKMMSISDIYDALTASDRPYKKAVPVERAVDILEYGVKDQHLDPELVRIFKDARVWELATPKRD